MPKHVSPPRVAAWSLVLLLLPGAAAAEWSQWGGSQRNFTAGEPLDLESFPDPGPRVLWDKRLGKGYSGIVSSGDRLVSMYRRDQHDVVACIAKQTGETLWEYAYAAPVPRNSYEIDTSFGDGPNSTPLLADGRAYTLSFSGIVNAIGLEDGTPAWSHDLSQEYGAPVPYFGHSASPVRHGNSVILVAGGAFAFDLDSGELRWQNRSFAASYASPLLVERESGPILIAAVAGEVVGLDPASGELLWRHEHANSHRTILNTPLFGADDRLFVSAYFLGSIGLKLSPDGRSVVEEWETPQLQLSHANALRVGDWVYGFHRSVLTALNVVTGEIGWRHRGLRNSSMIRVGDRFLLLDAVGKLTLVSLSPDGVVIHDETQVFEGRAWTAPTVTAGKLYARDQERIVALDLSRAAKRASGSAESVPPSRKALLQPEFRAAQKNLALAAHLEESTALAASRQAFEPWCEQANVAHLAHYYIAYGAWREAVAADPPRALALVNDAVDHLNEAIRLRKSFADAHALLAMLYPMYYRLDPQRAQVIGPLSAEHLELARLFAPDNPRVVLVEGLRLINRPEDHGGDLQAGLGQVRLALDLYEQAPADRSGVDPDWGRGLAWSWYGQALLRGAAEDRAQAPLAFERALEIAPELVTARRTLLSLDDGASDPEP